MSPRRSPPPHAYLTVDLFFQRLGKPHDSLVAMLDRRPLALVRFATMTQNTIVDWSSHRTLSTTPTAAAALRVGTALVDLVDASMKGAVARNAARLEERCKRLRGALERRGAKVTTTADSRPVDQRADRAWGALALRLQAWVSLGLVLGEDHEKVRKARDLNIALFADGLDFLTLPYAEQDVEMERLLGQIDAASLERDLISLAGREFVDAIRDVQPEYSAMVSSMLSRDDKQERVVLLVRDVVRAIDAYAAAVIVAIDEEVPADVARARALLAPIANFRAAADRDRSSSVTKAPEPPSE